MEGLKPFFKKPVLANFLLGMSSGFPLALVISLTAVWLSEHGVDKTTVGMFALATMPYAWKFLWSPIVDRLGLGRFSRLFGRRKAWLFLIQISLVISILFLATLDPKVEVGRIAVIITLIGFLSASQDIVIDAYRIEILKPEQLAYGASMINYGYRFSVFIVGYATLVISHYYGWAFALSLLPIMVIPGMIAAIWVGEPEIEEDDYLIQEHKNISKEHTDITIWLYEAVVLPFKEFLRRDNALLILLFILLIKAGDAVTAVMTNPLLVELGFTKLEMANANKLVGIITLLIGIGLGSLLYFRLGVYKSLFITGILMMVTNLVFAWLSTQGNDVYALAITIGAENFATGLGSTVIVAYLSSLCNISFTATQYALLSSLASQARAILGAPSGAWATSMGWVDFFIFSTLLAVPGLIVLSILWYKDVGSTKQKAE
jgi:PAT family beta-lactamase induction signal transducer AmpG